jgi:hypothetical protein
VGYTQLTIISITSQTQSLTWYKAQSIRYSPKSGLCLLWA